MNDPDFSTERVGSDAPPDLAVVARPTFLQTSRRKARKRLHQLDNEQVRRARGLLRALRHGQPDVLYLGDSAVSYVGANDTDQRRLRTMVSEGLGPETSIRFVDGLSFHADIYEAYLRLLEGTPHRPLVIMPLCVRVRLRPWIEHPVDGHKQALAKIRQIDPTKSLWRVHSTYKPPTPADFEEFYKVPYSTVLGDGVVGDYVLPIKSTDVQAERVRLLYAYHHGGVLTPGDPALDAVTCLGQRVKDLGLKAVVYQTPIPFEKASELLGPAMAERAAQSFTLMDEAYRKGAGADAHIIESGLGFSTSEFIDPDDATEHLNEFGRRRLTDLIVAEVKKLR